MRFSGLIFDIGDTLYDATIWRRWLTVRLRTLGVEITYADLVRQWEALLVDVYTGRADYWQRFARLLDGFGLGKAVAADLARQAQARGRQVQRVRRLFAGVRETLGALRDAGVRIAALSDTESGADDVRRSLEPLGIAACFDAVVCSADIGFAKPQRQAYEAAAEALGLSVDACAFVGHDAEELAGAMAAGMYAIAYNADPDAPADRRVEEFAELRELVLQAA